MYTSAKPYFYGTGRRKKSVARVRLYPGNGEITINGRSIDEYFGLETLKLIVNQPFGVTGTVGKFDIVATVSGGGISGQAGAIRHGVARALNAADAEYRPALKAAGFLTRDPRMKERKKYGLKAARRSPVLQEISFRLARTPSPGGFLRGFSVACVHTYGNFTRRKNYPRGSAIPRGGLLLCRYGPSAINRKLPFCIASGRCTLLSAPAEPGKPATMRRGRRSTQPRTMPTTPMHRSHRR